MALPAVLRHASQRVDSRLPLLVAHAKPNQIWTSLLLAILWYSNNKSMRTYFHDLRPKSRKKSAVAVPVVLPKESR